MVTNKWIRENQRKRRRKRIERKKKSFFFFFLIYFLVFLVRIACCANHRISLTVSHFCILSHLLSLLFVSRRHSYMSNTVYSSLVLSCRFAKMRVKRFSTHKKKWKRKAIAKRQPKIPCHGKQFASYPSYMAQSRPFTFERNKK